MTDDTTAAAVATDREKLLALLAAFGIIPASSGERYAPDFGPNSVVLLGECGNVDGYSGFYCRFDFAEDGKFTKAGVWE